MPRKDDASSAASSGTSRYNLRARDTTPSPAPTPASASRAPRTPRTPRTRRKAASDAAAAPDTPAPSGTSRSRGRPPSARRRSRPASRAEDVTPRTPRPASGTRSARKARATPRDRRTSDAAATQGAGRGAAQAEDVSLRGAEDAGEASPSGLEDGDEGLMHNIRAWRKVRLVRECRGRGLPTTGNKKELVQRILDSVEEHVTPAFAELHAVEPRRAQGLEGRPSFLIRNRAQVQRAGEQAKVSATEHESSQELPEPHHSGVTFVPPPAAKTDSPNPSPSGQEDVEPDAPQTGKRGRKDDTNQQIDRSERDAQTDDAHETRNDEHGTQERTEYHLQDGVTVRLRDQPDEPGALAPASELVQHLRRNNGQALTHIATEPAAESASDTRQEQDVEEGAELIEKKYMSHAQKGATSDGENAGAGVKSAPTDNPRRHDFSHKSSGGPASLPASQPFGLKFETIAKQSQPEPTFKELHTSRVVENSRDDTASVETPQNKLPKMGQTFGLPMGASNASPATKPEPARASPADVQPAARRENSPFSESPLPTPRSPSVKGDDGSSTAAPVSHGPEAIAASVRANVDGERETAHDSPLESHAAPDLLPPSSRMDGNDASEEPTATNQSPDRVASDVDDVEPERAQELAPFEPHDFADASAQMPQAHHSMNTGEEHELFGNTVREGEFNSEEEEPRIEDVQMSSGSSAGELPSEDNEVGGATNDHVSDGAGDPVDEVVEISPSSSDGHQDVHSGDSRSSPGSEPEAAGSDQLSPCGSYNSSSAPQSGPSPRSGASSPPQATEEIEENARGSSSNEGRRSSLSPLGEIGNTPATEGLMTEHVGGTDRFETALDSRGAAHADASGDGDQEIMPAHSNDRASSPEKMDTGLIAEQIGAPEEAGTNARHSAYVTGGTNESPYNESRRGQQSLLGLFKTGRNTLTSARGSGPGAVQTHGPEEVLPMAQNESGTVLDSSRVRMPNEPKVVLVHHGGGVDAVRKNAAAPFRSFSRLRKSSADGKAFGKGHFNAFQTSRGGKYDWLPMSTVHDKLKVNVGRISKTSQLRSKKYEISSQVQTDDIRPIRTESEAGRAPLWNGSGSRDNEFSGTTGTRRKRSMADWEANDSVGSGLKRQKTSPFVVGSREMPSLALTLRNLASDPDAGGTDEERTRQRVGRELEFGWKTKTEKKGGTIMEKLLRIEESCRIRHAPFRDVIGDRMKRNYFARSGAYSPMRMFDMGSKPTTIKALPRDGMQRRAKLRILHARRPQNTNKMTAESLRETMQMAANVRRWRNATSPFGRLSDGRAKRKSPSHAGMQGRELQFSAEGSPAGKRRRR